MRVGMLSLGCPKALVDSEIVLGKLDPRRFVLAESVTDCDLALINTCAFIHDAREESVDRILELVELKKEGRIRALVVIGCLVQRYLPELRRELEAVDAFVGSGDFSGIPGVIEKVLAGGHVVSAENPGYLSNAGEDRVSLTPKFYRYLKISEGCDHRCSFCSIPSFRGPHRSRRIEDVVREALRLTGEGAKEIILTGQDTAYFGRDYARQYLLADLLKELERIEALHWIRILYAYPSAVTPGLMRAMRDSTKVCRYLDMALQHVNNRILRDMRRGITKERTLEIIRDFRKTVPGLAIRTAFIVGYPGETQAEFEELLRFMEAMRFERVGIFTYSAEEGTPAALKKGQIPEEVKALRLNRAMLLQQELSHEFNRSWIGRPIEVLIEGKDEKDPDLWVGRSYMDAPEVDGNVYVRSRRRLKPGNFYEVNISEVKAYDLAGKV